MTIGRLLLPHGDPGEKNLPAPQSPLTSLDSGLERTVYLLAPFGLLEAQTIKPT